MKQLIALLCTMVITFILSVSIARAETILVKPALMLTSNNHTMYSYNEQSAGLMYVKSPAELTPVALNLESFSDTFAFAKEKLISDHNYFFEFSLIFNDKLQQLIAFLNRDDDENHTDGKVDSHSLSTKTSTQECPT